MAITVYSSPNCSQCRITKHILERDGITYTPVDLSTDLDAHRFVTRELGYKQAPIVYVQYPDGHTEHWAGLRPDRLGAYITAMNEQESAA